MKHSAGRSVLDKPIDAYHAHQSTDFITLVLAGMHGDEPKSVTIARRLIDLLRDEAPAGADRVGWVVVPVVNPDGYAVRKRRNANRVDINRNFPTQNWKRTSKRGRMFGGEAAASEPETRVVMNLVERFRPSAIISIHSIDRGRECNNYDGPGEAVARAMARFNSYPVRGSIGYLTPGSLGTWAGVERGIATVTLELPSHRSSKRCWEDNRDALLAWPRSRWGEDSHLAT